MNENNWSKLAGKLAGQITGVWFGCAIAVLVLIAPTKVIVWACQWFWGLF